jgi:hypothetical protein
MICITLYANSSVVAINSHSSCVLYGRIRLYIENFELLQVSLLLIDSSFYFSTFYTAMSEKQHSKRWRSDKSRDKSSSRRMEDDLNRSSFRSGDAADPYVPPICTAPSWQRDQPWGYPCSALGRQRDRPGGPYADPAPGGECCSRHQSPCGPTF